MTGQIIILCTLLLIAYLFDLTSHKTRIPSVILLLLLGWVTQQVVRWTGMHVADLNQLLPVLGTIGLILIVLEGSLDLELEKGSGGIIGKSLLLAFLSTVLLSAGLAIGLYYMGVQDIRMCITNAIPFGIVSSAVAIPAVRILHKRERSIVVYESSFSDIIGVVFFNFVMVNTYLNWTSVGFFFLDLLIILLISVVCTIFLSALLSRLQHHIKFGPILIFVVLIYEVTKHYHLPGLIFIMIFGIVLGNYHRLNIHRLLPFIPNDDLTKELKPFKDIVAETTFLVRSLFFLLFGFLINGSDLADLETLQLAGFIVAMILIIRAILLVILRIPLFPLLLISPRGLITILLFFSIAPEEMAPMVNKPLVVQVIIITVLLMMFGVIFNKKSQESEVPTALKNDE